MALNPDPERSMVAIEDVRMIALDIDGTLLGPDGQISPANRAALLAAEAAGVEIVVATGRRHFYAMKVLRGLGLRESTVVVSSNGAVVRTLGTKLIERAAMDLDAAISLAGRLAEFRNALVVTFDKVTPEGEDLRGALIVEEFEDLHSSIGKWMLANEPYIAHVRPIEDALRGEPPIQMMVCGTVARMRLAEARILEDPGVSAVGEQRATGTIWLNRTEYPERDLSIVDILPAGCSKGAALVRLARSRGFGPEALMAVGDNWNDLSMLELAGRPVLMGNAPEDLKIMAKRFGWLMTSTHAADGVAEAIWKVLPVTAG